MSAKMPTKLSSENSFPDSLNIDRGRLQLKSVLGARVRIWLEICSNCGLCAESCYHFVAGDRDYRLSPAYKFKHSLGEMVRRRGKLDRTFMNRCFQLVWLQCTLCRRCSLYCPFGIDIATMIALARSVCFSMGVTPDRLAEFSENCRKAGNHMGLSPQELIETCEWMAEETREDVPGVTIPVDRPDVDYMYTINPREVVFYPQDIAQAAILFSAAGESWTLPSTGWDCTNLPMFAGDMQLAGKVVKAVYDRASELRAKHILITECGHAYRSLAFEGPYYLGIPSGKPPVKVVHTVQLLYDYLSRGRLEVDPEKRLKVPVTYQDPCNVSRNGGLWSTARKIIPFIADDFRDMNPNRAYNHCCGGGGGLMPMGPEFKPGRIASGRVKAEQIRATGAELVISPCHNCYDQIMDLNEAYGLGVEVKSFKEILCEIIRMPVHLRAV